MNNPEINETKHKYSRSDSTEYYHSLDTIGAMKDKLSRLKPEKNCIEKLTTLDFLQEEIISAINIQKATNSQVAKVLSQFYLMPISPNTVSACMKLWGKQGIYPTTNTEEYWTSTKKSQQQ
jgi:hypothetical protein